MAQQFARRPITLFSDFNAPMPKSDAPVEGSNRKAIWQWKFSLTGKVIFAVNDGKYGENDKNSKAKEVELNFADRNQLLYLIQLAADDPNFKSGQWVVKKKQYNPSTKKFNTEPSVLAVFTIRRSEDGVVSVVYTKGMYKVNFIMINEESQLMYKDANGEVVHNRGLNSRSYVDSFVRFSRRFLDEKEWMDYKAPEPKNNNNNSGGNNSWGGSNNNNSNSGNNQPPVDFDDDIPF